MRIVFLIAILASMSFGRVVCEDAKYEAMWGDKNGNFLLSTTIAPENEGISLELVEEISDGVMDDIRKLIHDYVEAKAESLLDSKKCVIVGFDK